MNVRLCVFALVLTNPAFGEAPTEEQSSAPLSRADRAQQAVASGGDAMARWIDAFFDDPSVEAEEARSRFRLREIVTFSERESTRFRTRVSAKLHLPNLSDRVSLTFTGNDEEINIDENDTTQIIEDNNADPFDDPSFGLQYRMNRTGRFHSSLSLSTRLDNPSLNFGPRFRYRHALSETWRGRYTQRILWDTDDGWESRTRLDFDRPLASGNLFRQSLRVEWWESRKDDTGVRHTLSSAFIQRLEEQTAIKYSIASQFTTQPHSTWSEHRLSVHYRQNFWRDWMFLEVAPFIAFEDQFDWHPNPGIRLTLDMIFYRQSKPQASSDE